MQDLDPPSDRGSPERSAEREWQGAIDDLPDATDRKLLEEELRLENRHLQEANASLEARVQARTADLRNVQVELEAFSYSVSHDLRAPLRIVRGFAEALEQDPDTRLSAAARDYLERIKRSAARMGELIEQLLRLSRIDRQERVIQEVDLVPMAKEIFAQLAGVRPGRRIELVLPDQLKVQGDLQQLRVLLQNLLDNAWKFTALREAGRIEIGSLRREDGSTVQFVRDNGAGFPADKAGRLFRPFERLHAERDFPGTGMGLALARRIVTRHGGTIWAEGQVGEGACISFTLATESRP